MKKILIVEDDNVLLNLMCDQFTAEGFEVLAAVNGKDGLEVALKDHPDLILVDILMPIMDGMEMTTKIREDQWGKKVKIIVLTNLNNEEKVAEFLEKGSYDYLVKSDWPLREVVERVKSRLGMG
jgi:two-component system alkaline phosphatase synthesis response regulator PhoP